MYHCLVRFYLIGHPCDAFEVIKEMPPLEHFGHLFSEGDKSETALPAEADVVIVNLSDAGAREALRTILSDKRAETEVILLADKEQAAQLAEDAEQIQDIWITPMTDAEVRFRFRRWQQACKLSRDYIQTDRYLEAAINNTPNLVWFKDKDGVHKLVNDSFCKSVNKTKEQVEGRRHAYIWDVEEDDPACIESEREVMEKRQTCVAEEEIRTGDGMRTLMTYKSPLYDFDGSVMGTVGVGIDVTQERLYAREIVRKNHTLETIFKSIDCGVICHSLDGTRILSINRAALKILGYESQSELEGKGFDMIAESVVEKDRASLKSAIERLKEEGDSVSVEYRVRHKNGEILHVMGNVKLLSENGELYYQRFLLDCTVQKLQEEEKEQHQKELIQALSIDYTLVYFFDLNTGMGTLLRNDNRDGQSFDVNDYQKISYEEGREQYIQKLVHEEDREMLREATAPDRLIRELAEKDVYSVNYRIQHNGEMQYFQMRVVRAGSWDENHGIVLGLHSVDEETRSEMEKKSLLEDALSQANRASKAKSIFLSNMSHDIRTPMNAIVGFTSLALTHIDRKEQVEEYLKKIMTSGNHLLSLINDVLDMSRIESGKIHLEEKLCSLPDILHGLRNIVQADIHAKQMDLQIDAVDVRDEEIYCDKLRLNQVLLNLISNSIKYTGAGGTINMRIIERTSMTEGYATYEFHIKDNGIGMSEEFISHIFEPFEREENSTISGIQGTGLGMAITKNIVDMMNGTIEVKSEQGVGTEFIVEFTFRLHSGEKEAADIPEFKNCRALVVDDDFNTCDSVSYMLQQIGMRAEWTLSGKEALLRSHQAVMRGNEYEVYIIDWMMPDMNGVEVARRIRKEMGGGVPIIILTAYDWSDIEDEAKEAGVTAFCSKPLFFSELRSCLRSVVNAEEAEEQNSGASLEGVPTGRILLAEDNELNQEIAIAILEDAGFFVEAADNGRIAVDMVKQAEAGYYQVVLMDVQMPEMNGYEATKEIRRLENKEMASIPIIAMTANAFEEDKREALRCGMDGHIAKPINVEILLDTLRKILSSAK
ncbi:MAG: response regulator [Roseburia sp.]|nr:response regulator [Roseburia sp.]